MPESIRIRFERTRPIRRSLVYNANNVILDGMELSSIGLAMGRLGSDSSRGEGGEVEAGRLSPGIWMITAKLLWILWQWSVHVFGHDITDNWLLKDDTEANEVMESVNEFHSVIVLAAKHF